MYTDDVDLNGFFAAYGAAFRDASVISSMYADCAIASTPGFVGCLKGRDEINEAMKTIAAYQEQTGMTSLAPLSLIQTPVDELHEWVKVRWGATFKKTGERIVPFDISYLVRMNPDGPKILLYVSHQDEMRMRAELGIR